MKFLFKFIMALGFVPAFGLLGLQGQVPSVTPIPTGEQSGIDKKEPKDAQKNGRIRLWDFSYSQGGIAVYLGPVGEQAPPFEKRIWIARGSKSPEKRDWLEVPPGDYEIFAEVDDAIPGDMGKKIGPGAPPSASLLQKRQGVKIEGNSYQTIILYQANGKILAKLINDSQVNSASPLLRVFVFQTEIKPTISLVDNNGVKKTLAENIGVDGANLTIPPSNSPVTFEISYPLRPDFISRQNVELEFQGHKSSSIIISPDRYGDISTEFTTDAPAANTIP